MQSRFVLFVTRYKALGQMEWRFQHRSVILFYSLHNLLYPHLAY